MTAVDESRPTPAEVLDKLGALGSARQIADYLAAQGVTGWPSLANRCPVSQWVLAESGLRISLSKSGWDLWAPDDLMAERVGATPEPVGEFIVAFDNGAYRELDARADPAVTCVADMDGETS